MRKILVTLVAVLSIAFLGSALAQSIFSVEGDYSFVHPQQTSTISFEVVGEATPNVSAVLTAAVNANDVAHLRSPEFSLLAGPRFYVGEGGVLNTNLYRPFIQTQLGVGGLNSATPEYWNSRFSVGVVGIDTRGLTLTVQGGARATTTDLSFSDFTVSPFVSVGFGASF